LGEDSVWKSLFMQAPVGLGTSDLTTGRFLLVNPAYANLTGYGPEEMREMTYLDLTHPDDREMNQVVVERLLDQNSPSETFRKRYLRKSGQTIWVEVQLALLRDENGEPVSFMVQTQDISELIEVEERRRVAAEAVRRSEERLREILEASTTGVGVNDPTGRFIYANRLLLGLLGYSPQDLAEGRLTWDAIQDPILRPTDDQALAQLRATGQCEPYETELVRSDGKRIPVYLGAAFVPDDDGKGILGATFVTDLTALRDVEEELRSLNSDLDQRVQDRTADLEMANREMEGFTYHVAHDLRAPLRAIVSTSRMMLSDHAEDLNSEASILLERQALAANKLGTLIDELLKLSRLARAEPHKEALDLSVIAADVASEHASENSLISLEIESGLRSEGDPRLVRLLLSNLISNAYRYSPGGGKVTIGIVSGEFFVKDEGIGFDMVYADKLFRPFERLVTDAEFPGTGVGLANAARIVEKHGGKIRAESEPGKGATFYFTL
jgi:PAS domain S-box-containing protein